MQHRDDVRAPLERFGITRLLIPAVTAVFRMNHKWYAETLRNLNGVIARCIVHEQEVIDHVHGNLGYGLLEGSPCIVGGKNDHHALAVDHERVVTA